MMQAFGAYADKEVIDFTELNNEQIFIVSGKTGAGKSTIFDAISFAIFGKNNTSDRDGISMRSHFASPELRTEVSLTFKLGTRTFRIERTPQQEIAKKKKEGMRTINQKAVLYEQLANEEKLLASSIRDVDSRISELMQLTVDQFRQILMIPQGEFRELLTSDSKEKETILQRLAHTYVYKQLEDKLWEKEKTLASDIQQKRQTLYLIAENSLEAKKEVYNMTLEAIQSQFKAEISQKEAEQIESELALKKARKEAEEAANTWTLAKNLQTDFDYLEKYHTELLAFESKKAEVERQIERLNQAKKAVHLQSQDVKCQQLKIRQTKREKELESLKQALNTCINKLDITKAEMKQWEQQSTEIEMERKKLYQLENLTPKITKWEQLQVEMETDNLTQLANELALEEKKKLAFETEIIDIQTQKEELIKLEMEQLKKESTLASVKYELENLQVYQTQQIKIANYQKEITAIQQQITVNETQTEPLVLQVEELENQQKKQQAAVLAGHLHDGEACPVCGSISHPMPATFTVEFDFSFLEAQSKKLQNYKNEKEKLIVQKQQLTWQLDQLTKVDLPNQTELADQLQVLKRQKEQLLADSKEITAQLSKRTSLETRLNDLQTSKHELEKNFQLKQESYETKKRKQEKISAEQSFLEQEIPTKYQNPQKFSQEKQQLAERLTNYDQRTKELQEVFRQETDEVSRKDAAKNSISADLAQISKELEEERSIFKGLLKKHHFNTYDAYKQATLTTEELEKKENQIHAFQNDYEIAKMRYQDLAAKLENQTVPDLHMLERVKMDKQLLRDQFEEQAVKVRDKLIFKQENFERLKQASKQIATQEEKYAEIGFLADTARGKNERKITFERYVLGTFLDTIVERSNLRLAKMTGGRFQLSRKLERSKGNGQSGLELEIYDAYTGYMRHVRTLSGGESFKTSLALALALAEVVQEMAGGISLETMFIDEGFGTLDPESLEMAVECLLETQESGRLVGIISHVPELKERIPVRLEVTATNHGSKTAFVHTI